MPTRRCGEQQHGRSHKWVRPGPLGLRRWEFPQGTAPDLMDVEPAALAERELREETGLRAESMVFLGLLDVAIIVVSRELFALADLHHVAIGYSGRPSHRANNSSPRPVTSARSIPAAVPSLADVS